MHEYFVYNKYLVWCSGPETIFSNEPIITHLFTNKTFSFLRTHVGYKNDIIFENGEPFGSTIIHTVLYITKTGDPNYMLTSRIPFNDAV